MYSCIIYFTVLLYMLYIYLARSGFVSLYVCLSFFMPVSDRLSVSESIIIQEVYYNRPDIFCIVSDVEPTRCSVDIVDDVGQRISKRLFLPLHPIGSFLMFQDVNFKYCNCSPFYF